MREVYCFKSKSGTEYDKAIKKHFTLSKKWEEMYDKVGELLGEKITKLGLYVHEPCVDYYELKNEENKKIFKKDGTLKKSFKKSKQLLTDYKELIAKTGLEEYMSLAVISFSYNVMRRNGENLESFVTSDYDMYFKADFDLKERSNGMVVPITEIEYQEKYLEELKKCRDGQEGKL